MVKSTDELEEAVLAPVEYRRELEEEDLLSQSDLLPQWRQEETTRRNVQRNPRKRMPCPKPENTKGKVIQRTNALTKDNRAIKRIRTLLNIGASSWVRTATLDKSTLLKQASTSSYWSDTNNLGSSPSVDTQIPSWGTKHKEFDTQGLTSLSTLVFTY